MPKTKPISLSTKHRTKNEIAARESGENAMTPRTALSLRPPADLSAHAVAKKVWTRVIGLYEETEAKIATAFDQDLLVKYCLAEEELTDLQALKVEIFAERKDVKAVMTRLKRADPEAWLEAIDQYNALTAKYLGIDGRIDNKRKMIHKMAESLYLTPRSRAGVAPPEKPAEKPKTKMEKILDE